MSTCKLKNGAQCCCETGTDCEFEPAMSKHETTLLPCPFCGSAAELKHKSGSWGYYSGSYFVGCTKCECVTSGFNDEKWEQGKGTFSIAEEAKANAVARWNRRAALKGQQ